MAGAADDAATAAVAGRRGPARRRVGGFTLIELAIVIFIIGILTVGALVTGRSVLARARVASLLTNVKDLAAASRAFKTRFGYFPGDLPNAGTYITTNGGIVAGCTYAVAGAIGDGLVNTATESDCALEHLVKAGTLSKLDYDAVNSKYRINSALAAGVQVSLWYNAGSSENVVRVTNLPCAIALEIESKFDSTTTANTPFSQGFVIAQDAGGTQIANCIPLDATGGPLNDPVPVLLIKY